MCNRFARGARVAPRALFADAPRYPNVTPHAMAQSDSNAGGLTPNYDSEVARIVVAQGFIPPAELESSQELQKQASDPNQRSLLDVLVQNQLLTSNQAKRVRGQVDESVVAARNKKSQIPGYELISELGKGAMARVFK